MEPTVDIVQLLLETPFLGWKQKHKTSLLTNYDIPRPLLNCHAVKNVPPGKTHTRNFQNSWYGCFKWLCGSQYKQKLFCWPCLLFGTKKGCWNQDGFHDMVNAVRSFQRHEGSIDHIKSWVIYKTSLIDRGVVPTDGSSTEDADRLSVTNYNNDVQLNRRWMHLPINAVLFLVKQELSIHNDQNDGTAVKNKGHFEELLNLLINTTKIEIKEHYDKNKNLFPAITEVTQDELLVSTSFILSDFIKNEIGKADFFSIIVHDTTDAPTNAMPSVVIRYVNCSGLLVERFIGFLKVGSIRSADSVFASLNNLLSNFIYRTKLIAQSYDGSSVMPRHLDLLQKKVKNVAPQALFVHSVSHRLNLIIKQSTCSVTECRNFFANLGGIPLFFHAISKSKFLAECNIETRIPTAQDTRWCSHSKVLNVLVEDWDGLRKTLRKLMCHEWSDENTIRLAESFYNKLNSFQFAFLAVVFKDIFDNFDLLTNVIRKDCLDLKLCMKHIDNTRNRISMKRNEMFLEFLRYVSRLTNVKMETCGDEEVVVVEKYKAIYFNILGVIVNEINVRFRDFETMSFLNLGDCKKFNAFSKKFPTDKLDNLHSLYGSFFDRSRLKNELEYIYSDSRFQHCSVEKMLRKLNSTDLKDVFKEAYKFFSLLLTIPLTRYALDNGYSSLNRIKTYLRSPNASLSGLHEIALLSIEKNLLLHLNRTTPLHEDIIDSFAALKNRTISLVFKKGISRFCSALSPKSNDKNEEDYEISSCPEDNTDHNDSFDKPLKEDYECQVESEKDGSQGETTSSNVIDSLLPAKDEVNMLIIIDDEEIDENNHDGKSAEEILGQPTDIVADMPKENKDYLTTVPCNENYSITKDALKKIDSTVSENVLFTSQPKRKHDNSKSLNPEIDEIVSDILQNSNKTNFEPLTSSLTMSVEENRNKKGATNVLDDVLNRSKAVPKKRQKTIKADRQIEGVDKDEDKEFLLSLLPAMKELTVPQKYEFKILLTRELNRLKYSRTVTTATSSTANLSNTTKQLSTPLASLGNMSLIYRTIPVQNARNTTQRFPVLQRPMLNNPQIINNINNAFPQQQQQQLVLKPLSELLPNKNISNNQSVKQAKANNPEKTTFCSKMKNICVSPLQTFSNEFITGDLQPISYMNPNKTLAATNNDFSQLKTGDSSVSKNQVNDFTIEKRRRFCDATNDNDELSDKSENGNNIFREVLQDDSDSELLCSEITVEEIKFEPVKKEPCDQFDR